jgi:hypothetical protein
VSSGVEGASLNCRIEAFIASLTGSSNATFDVGA